MCCLFLASRFRTCFPTVPALLNTTARLWKGHLLKGETSLCRREWQAVSMLIEKKEMVWLSQSKELFFFKRFVSSVSQQGSYSVKNVSGLKECKCFCIVWPVCYKPLSQPFIWFHDYILEQSSSTELKFVWELLETLWWLVKISLLLCLSRSYHKHIFKFIGIRGQSDPI